MVKWERPNSGGAITNEDNSEGYTFAQGTYNSGDNSQTATLIVPEGVNSADATYTCVIQCEEHGKTDGSVERVDVQSNVFSESLFLKFSKFSTLFLMQV